MCSVSIKKSEIDKFSKYSDEWWDESGSLWTLHVINVLRMKYIVNIVSKSKYQNKRDIRVLDIGCGGGILAESLSRLYDDIVAIDVVQDNIDVAKAHCANVGISNIDYHCTSVEDLCKIEIQSFDLVVCMEVLEHVNEVESFVKKCLMQLKKGGLCFFSTINRTTASFLKAIIAAEYILGWLPRGTHSWQNFIKPNEIKKFLSSDVNVIEISGMSYGIFDNEWVLSKDISVNYIMSCIRE